MSDETLMKLLDCIPSFVKRLALQLLILYLMPYLWSNQYSIGTLVMIVLYTSIYVIYWNLYDKENRFKYILLPYALYSIIALFTFFFVEKWSTSVWLCLLLPLYGLICFIGSKLFSKYSKRIKKSYKLGNVFIYIAVIAFFITLKTFCVIWGCSNQGSFNTEKTEILERQNYLINNLITTPRKILNQMPSFIGTQFQGEWALYSCSMLSAALVNISELYPETRKQNIERIDSLINIVMSEDLRYYDYMRWGEDPLETLDGDESHVSYISHLAWMICGYKEIGGNNQYDDLLSKLCSTMNRRLLNSNGLNLPTYPGESIYIPDMLVAIVALNQYADLNNGKYRSTVNKWLKRAKKNWLDKETGLLVSFLSENGEQYKGIPVKGSYSALNCYYLTFIDEKFAKQQYKTLKSYFWKDGLLSGLKEYYDRTCYIGLDIDAGPILFELSPSGTAFMAGAATYFEDRKIMNEIFTTAEIAGHSVKWGNQRHYLLANVALVGESIMLAMRTHN